MRQSVYLSNLPASNASRIEYARQLLKSINKDNPYALSAEKTLPEPLPSADVPLPLLDEKYGVVSVSRPRKCRNKCFLGFATPSQADEFLQNFKDRLFIYGHQVNIEPAKHDAFWYIEREDPRACQRLRKHRAQLADPEAKLRVRSNRRLRRLRSRLRKRGLDAEHITEVVQRIKEKSKPSAENKTVRERTPSSAAVADPKKRVVDVANNPPNKVLLVQDLPTDITEQELVDIFANDKLLQVRLVQVRQLAFVDYADVQSATAVKNKLGTNYVIKNQTTIIGYAK